jgi:3-oxoacyl-[acyl-carrier-protein] synthase-1
MHLLSSGQAGWVLAGAADSYFQLDVLEQLDREGRVKSSRHLDGFIPGEGAGWLLLTRRAKAERAGLPVLAVLSVVAAGVEEGHIYSPAPYFGDGLARTLEALVSNAISEPVREVFSSMNGERYWSKEWGVAFLRNRAAFHPEYRMHHPADSFGDIGAACGPLLVSLAITGITQAYRHAPCLVYSSSDHAERAAVLVSPQG